MYSLLLYILRILLLKSCNRDFLVAVCFDLFLSFRILPGKFRVSIVDEPRQGVQRHPFSCFFSKEKIERKARLFAKIEKIKAHKKNRNHFNKMIAVDFCDDDGIRTHTPLRAPPPQDGKSTSFSTSP